MFVSRYRSKIRRYEKQIHESVGKNKTKAIELSKESSHSKELEIKNLKLQKEFQELTYEVEQLKHELLESDNRLKQFMYEKSQLEEALSHTNIETKQTSELQVMFCSLFGSRFILHLLPYRTKLCRTKFSSPIEIFVTFVQQKMLSIGNFVLFLKSRQLAFKRSFTVTF